MVEEVTHDHHGVESQYLESCIGRILPQVLSACLIKCPVCAEYPCHSLISLAEAQAFYLFIYLYV